MKKKLLIGGGLVALIAVIVAIVMFARGGDFFKGSLPDFEDFPEFEDPFQNIELPPVSEGPDFYVSNTITGKTCDDSNPRGSKKCPFPEIYEALVATGGATTSIIYVAEGSYKEFAYNGQRTNRSLKGGYNNTFTSSGLKSIIYGTANLANIKGEITGFEFKIQDESILGLKVLNTDETMDIHNNRFIGGLTADSSIILSGSKVKFRDNYISVKSIKSVVSASGSATVENNNFYRSVAGESTEGIVKINGAYAFNNLITNCLSGTSNAIVGLGNSLIANNTISDNMGLLKFALNIQATSKAYNNLVVNTGGGVLAKSEFAVVSNNGAYNSFVKQDYLQDGNSFLCDPKFKATRGVHTEDYKLGSDSPCIDKGIQVSQVTKDAFGTTRPQNSKYDVGFHEVPAQLIQVKTIDPIVVEMASGVTTQPTEPEEPEEITPVCGNGTKESGEQCDDGNKINGDGCSSTCQIEEEEEDDDDDDTVIIPPVEGTECGKWTDISKNDQEYDMWIYLCEKGILKGSDDGTLRPEDKLNRAELLALATRAGEFAKTFKRDSNARNCFPDVKTQWYAEYFCSGKNEGFIQGYPDGYARPERGVILAEGLKMFLGALDEPFDVSDLNCWYCDMVEEAGNNKYLPYSFTDPKQVGPIELTRRKAFNMLYRIMIYR